MQFSYSELIEKFSDVLGTPKELINETFNKPDATDIIVNRCISVKNLGEYYMLIIFQMDGQVVRFLYAYRIYPKLFDGVDISKMKPIQVLTELMNRYGISKSIPGFGERKILVEKNSNIFFPGILNMEAYLEAVKNI